jgi:hypothetical protein
MARDRDRRKRLPGELVGAWFLILDEKRKVQYGGVVLRCVEPGWYTVQLLEWVAGTLDEERLWRIGTLDDAILFDDADGLEDWIGTHRHSMAYESQLEGGAPCS